jgi:hypothetical protein
MPETDTPDCVLRLIVPSDPKYVEMVRDVAGSIAVHVRYTHAETLQVRGAVALAAMRAVMASAGDTRGVEVSFGARDGALEIDLRFACRDCTVGGTAGAGDVQRGWDDLSSLVSRVDATRTGDLMAFHLCCRPPAA